MKATLSVLGLYRYNPNVLNTLHVPDGVDKQNVIDNILLECAELEVLYPDDVFFSMAVDVWSKKELPTWEHIYNMGQIEYNPLENFDRYEETTDTRTEQAKDSGTDSQTVNDTFSSSLDDDGTSTGTTTNGGLDQVSSLVSAFDNTGLSPHDTVETLHGHTVSESGSHDNRQESSGTSSSVGNLIHGKQTDTTGETTHTGHLHGNIGVTTVAQMMQGELDTFPKINIVSYITESFRNRFCLLVY